MPIRVTVLATCLVGAATVVGAQSPSLPARAPGTRISTAVDCAASLGTGVKSRRTFCDAVIAAAPKDSVLVNIPDHAGTATLFFDLHNRFTLPEAPGAPELAFAKHAAIVRVVRGTGQEIGRAASIREFRTPADLFDQIGGGGRPGGIKAIAPGPAESVRFTIPAGVSSIGIVGLSLRVRSVAIEEEVFDTPGRPVAIVSNVRVEYRPK